jgi:hypothetical protein
VSCTNGSGALAAVLHLLRQVGQDPSLAAMADPGMVRFPGPPGCGWLFTRLPSWVTKVFVVKFRYLDETEHKYRLAMGLTM